MAFALYFKAPGERFRSPRGADAVLHLDEPGVSGYPIHHNLEQFLTSPQAPSETVVSFLITALGVWAADKLLPRSGTRDAWTREIALHLPASGSWQALFPRLARLLSFLTGDGWTLVPRERPLHPGFSASWPYAWRPQAVTLFSGGLDSLTGAIDLLEAGKRLLLVSHHDFGQLASAQQRLAASLRDYYGPDRVEHLGLRVQFPQSSELTLRSRSLLYLALGLTAAAAFGTDTALIIPENGWISLNLPLTLNRLGPYSTRTTHPYFLKELAGLWQKAGILQPLVNPCRHLAKGQMLEQCRNRKLLKELYPLTVSCARPEVGRWHGLGTGACGYCYPCLMRRAALHCLGWDNGGDYRVDVMTDPEIVRHRVKGGDLRALLLALKTWERTPEEMEARLWLEGEPEAFTQTRSVLEAGFREISAFFRDKGGNGVLAYLDEPAATILA